MTRNTNGIALATLLLASPASALEEDFSLFPNPDRGFYLARDLADPRGLGRFRERNVTLLRGDVRLGPFRETPELPQRLIDELQRGFDAAHAAGIKVVVRGAYGHRGPGGDYRSYRDPDGRVIKGHIEQLAPLFERNAHLIAFFEAGFVGPWGEWHTTPITKTPARQREFFFHILDHTPASRMVVLRYPELKRSIFDRREPLPASRAYDGSRLARTGHHNDCFLSSRDDVGTYNRGRSNREEETAYLAAETLHTVYGGETCRVHELSDAGRAIRELERLHASYLNREYHPGVLRKWKDQECYDEISRRLGARLVARSVERTAGEIRIEIENVGFASLYNERPVRLVLAMASGERRVVPLDDDPRHWKPGATVTLRHPAPAGGVERLGLHLPDAAPQLADNPAYAFRLANKGAWDADSGINWLSE